LEQGVIKQKGLFNLFEKQKYLMDNVFVCYSAFRPIAREEAVGKIPEDRIKRLKSSLTIKIFGISHEVFPQRHFSSTQMSK
jgi:hypothetical protein